MAAPRFKGQNFFTSLEYHYGDGSKLKNNKLYLQSIGNVKIKLHRELEGKIKNVIIKKDVDQFYVVFQCEVVIKPLPKTNKTTGIDLGISTFVTLSDGTEIDNQSFYQIQQKQLRVLNRSLARKKKGGKNRKKVVKQLQKFYQKIRNRRLDYQHKVANYLVKEYDLIAIEKLDILNMSPELSKQILDVAWGQFTSILSYKAESADKKLIKVNPAYTSQDCSNCGDRVKKKLNERIHSCKKCGLKLTRDHNAAINIHKLGLSLIGANVKR